MTNATTNITFTTYSANLGVAVFNDIKDYAVKQYMFRKTVSELRELSRLELADLGLSYSGIKAAAREAVYGA